MSVATETLTTVLKQMDALLVCTFTMSPILVWPSALMVTTQTLSLMIALNVQAAVSCVLQAGTVTVQSATLTMQRE